MKHEIRILLLEDDPASVPLIQRELRRGGIHAAVHRVETRPDFLDQLAHHRPDLILSDHGLPAFDGFSALAIARNACPHVPFVFVTGRRGEEEVVEALRRGASDYVLKDRISRLLPAVERALHGFTNSAGASDNPDQDHDGQPAASICLDALFATSPDRHTAPDDEGIGDLDPEIALARR